MVGPHASVCGVSARPVLQGVLPGGPRCVRELRLSLAPSNVLHCPMLGFSVASATLAAGLGLSWVLCSPFCRLGFCTSVGGSACAMQPLASSYRVVLTVAAGLGRFLVLSIMLPWPSVRFQVHLLCLLSAGCFLGLEPSPSGVASASAWRFSWRPVAAGALAVILPAATSRGVLPSLLGPSPSGVCHLSCFCSSVGGHVGVAHSFHPSLFLGGGLVRFCGGLCWRSLAMSWACPQPFLCFSLVARSRRIVAPLALCLGWRFPSLVRFSLMRWGVSPCVGSVGALGELRWLHFYRLPPDLVGLRQFAVWLWGSGRCFLFSCATFRTCTWRSFCQFPWLLRAPTSSFP